MKQTDPRVGIDNELLGVSKWTVDATVNVVDLNVHDNRELNRIAIKLGIRLIAEQNKQERLKDVCVCMYGCVCLKAHTHIHTQAQESTKEYAEYAERMTMKLKMENGIDWIQQYITKLSRLCYSDQSTSYTWSIYLSFMNIPYQIPE